ncbi:signal peptidase II [Streptomyces sp. NPDC006251]|uniref:signal peptidase II n=1 Tax=Streptomyces sp. NPDC006251 TaxID=3155718 RepID=UPI0033A80253
MSATTTAPARAARTRAALAGLAILLATLDLGLKAWADTHLPGDSVDLGLIQLQLAYNPGVAFSVGDTLPGWVVIAGTGLITAGIAVFAWRTAATAGRLLSIALASILGGAAANVIDRAGDGVVTDYLHTGWWPTFNLADVFIVTGGLAIVVLSWRRPDHEHGESPAT